MSSIAVVPVACPGVAVVVLYCIIKNDYNTIQQATYAELYTCCIVNLGRKPASETGFPLKGLCQLYRELCDTTQKGVLYDATTHLIMQSAQSEIYSDCANFTKRVFYIDKKVFSMV